MADIKATPVASAIIADKKVDPKTVTPSGFQGKILKDDVLAALSNPGKKAFAGAELVQPECTYGENEQSPENNFTEIGRSKEYNGDAHYF